MADNQGEPRTESEPYHFGVNKRLWKSDTVLWNEEEQAQEEEKDFNWRDAI